MLMNRLGIRSIHRWVHPTLKHLRKKQASLPATVPDPRNTYVEWNYEAEIYAFGKRLNEEFNNDQLRQALMDRSFVNIRTDELKKLGMETDEEILDNQSLSEKGNRLLENYIDRYLSLNFPFLPKKYADQLKNHLMSTDVLSQISSCIGLNDIILGDKYPLQKEVLVTGFKAVVAALANSSGENRSHLFISDLVLSQLCSEDLTLFITPNDPVAELSAELKDRGYQPPEPRLIGQAAVNTLLPAYRVGIYSDKKLIGKGFGESPEIAEEMAACDALWKLWGVTLNMKPLPIGDQNSII